MTQNDTYLWKNGKVEGEKMIKPRELTYELMKITCFTTLVYAQNYLNLIHVKKNGIVQEETVLKPGGAGT